jgi:threonine/homoserine/homoserine lactone efflux protein
MEGEKVVTIFWLGFALAASPGPDFFLMVNHTLLHGRKIGYVTLLGNRLSLLCHMTFAIFGLSQILEHSASAIMTVRILGASYLIFLGLKNLLGKLKGKKNVTLSQTTNTINAYQAFQRGFLNNLLNPKVSLFFLSIFPQFTTAKQLATSPLEIAVTFFVGNSLWYAPILYVIGVRIIRNYVQRIQKGLDIAFGAIYIGYGFKILWNELRLRSS